MFDHVGCFDRQEKSGAKIDLDKVWEKYCSRACTGEFLSAAISLKKFNFFGSMPVLRLYSLNSER